MMMYSLDRQVYFTQPIQESGYMLAFGDKIIKFSGGQIIKVDKASGKEALQF
jgi:hypothetical protein